MVYDCIVIGAGIQGSCTAYHLAKNNKKTLLLDQFVLPHSRGSSHGQTRIIRKAYEEDFYIRMMEDSYELWAQLEMEAGVKLHRSGSNKEQRSLQVQKSQRNPRQTALLLMGPENKKDFQLIKIAMQRNKVPMQMLERHEFSQYIPNVNLTSGDAALLDTTAGILYADRAIRAAQTVFQSYGGIIKDGEKVLDIKPGSIVTVTTASGIYQAKSLVITAGPWVNSLLSFTGLQLPLQVLKINVCYWKEKILGSYSVNNHFPCFIQLQPKEAQHDIYGLPSNEYPGLMKVCYHMGSETEPDERDRQTDRSDVYAVSQYISRCFPGLEPVPAVVESCLYTVTPDKNFILDHHPTYRNIVIGAGFSGHGFKFGPVIGKVLCELSMDQVPSHDLSPFSIKRFQVLPKSVL